ncbi:MAG: hypothetical protein GYB36_11385 [Alphaproteobacteria bacterium]|nr:hypothetical protein [Alphaproteobacteria bacterium]
MTCIFAAYLGRRAALVIPPVEAVKPNNSASAQNHRQQLIPSGATRDTLAACN